MTTSPYGRAQVEWPDLGSPAGAPLHAEVTAGVAYLSNNLVSRWSGSQAIVAAGSFSFTHNFALTLANLRIRLYESGAELTEAAVTAGFTIAQVDTNTISVTNTGGSTRTVQVYLEPIRRIRDEDIDPALETALVKTTGAQTLSDKTLTSPELDTPLIDDYFDINEEAAPGTPAAGKVRVYAKSDAKLYKKDDTGLEQEIGAGGGSGGVNYIANPIFADGTVTGWAAYADAAATTPVDGTGGTPTVTFTAQSGSLVRGTFSGRLTKDAANRQGQGASYAFTIDAADAGRPVSIALDFLASSAYVTGDVDVFIYDVTNNVLITPSNIDVPSGKGTFKAFFVASTSTSYRLILHVASTNASAWTLDTDNFQVGPQVQLSGAAVTDWVSYTPTFAGFGTVSTTDFEWRREGDTLFIRGRFLTGTPTGATASFTIPSGIQLATRANALLVGSGYTQASSGTHLALVQQPAATTALEFGRSENNPLATLLGTDISAVALTILIEEVSVKIATWSSNVTMAERAVEEYAFNTSTSTGTDTTSFGNGLLGASLQAFAPGGTASIQKRVRFQNAIQATDKIKLKLKASGATAYIDFDDRLVGFSANDAGTTYYGYQVVQVNSTDVDVYFYSSAAPGISWGAGLGTWILEKVSGGAVVGYPVSGKNVIPEYVVLPAINSSTTINFGIGIRFVSSGTPTTQTLQAVTSADVGKAIYIKNTGVGEVTLQGTGGALIDGAATLVLSSFESVQVVTDGTNWFII